MDTVYSGVNFRHPKVSELESNGIPSECTYTPFWDASFRSAALLGTGSFDASSLVYRSRSPDPAALVTSYLAGFRLDDRSMPLGRLPKKNATPLETEIVNGVAVCYIPSLITDNPVVFTTQPSCCACCDALPRDPDPFSNLSAESKSAAALSSAKNRTVTVFEQFVPGDSISELEGTNTPIVVLPTGAAHSGIEIVALSHSLEDVAYLGDQKVYWEDVKGPSAETYHKANRAWHAGGDTGCGGRNEVSFDEAGHIDSQSPQQKHNIRVASCSLGIEGRFLAELHPQAFQWTQGIGERIRSSSLKRCGGRGAFSCCCCHRCCLCPMGREVHVNGSVRNIFDRPDARHASHPLDTIIPKESLISERILEIRVDDKHPFIKLIMARNSRGIYVARLRLTEEDVDEKETHEAIQSALGDLGSRGSSEALLSGHIDQVLDKFADGTVVRRLHIDVLHDVRYGSVVPGEKTASGMRMPCSEGPPRFALPKKNPGYPTVVNIAVSPTSVGEFALLYSSQVVSLWTAGEARMEISDLISLSDSTKTMRRSVGSTLLWGHRTALADSSREHFQTLCYAKHAYNTILLGSDHIWAKDLREPGLIRLFPAIQPPTYSSRLHHVAECFYAPCPTHSSFHTCFTALAPHPTQPFLLAAAHGATEAVFLFDARAMHQPLTVIDLPSCRKTGARYRSLLWHSSKADWVLESEIQQMHATYLCGPSARAAASSTAIPVTHGATHDLLAAFSWRSEDVVCSAFTVHAAFCPNNRANDSATEQETVLDVVGGRDTTSATLDESEPPCRGNQLSKFACEQSSGEYHNDKIRISAQSSTPTESSSLALVRSGCLPKVIQRELVEVSWQVRHADCYFDTTEKPVKTGYHILPSSAEICMFPRTAWGVENKSRTCPIPSDTPLGAEGLMIPPMRVTVDEHSVSGVFHGYAGACLLDLPLKGCDSTVFDDGCIPSLHNPRCRECLESHTHVGSNEVHSNRSKKRCYCSELFCSLEGTPSDKASYISVIGVLTTSGRLFCRPLTMRNRFLHLTVMRRSLQNSFMGKQKLLNMAEESENCHSHAIPRSETSNRNRKQKAFNGNSDYSNPSRSECSDIRSIVRMLQSTGSEVCAVPQKVTSLMLEADLVNELQRQFMLQAALRWKCPRLHLRAHQCHTKILSNADHIQLNSRRTALQYLKNCVSTLRMCLRWNASSLPSFNFCDSGSLALHKPAFLLEYYDPEPVVQMLLTNHLPQESNAGMDFSSIDLGAPNSMHDEQVEGENCETSVESSEMPGARNYLVGVEGDFGVIRNSAAQGSQEPPSRPHAASYEGFMPGSCREQLEEVMSIQNPVASVSPLLEISSVPFRTVREKSAFVYMVQALHSVACWRAEECVRRLHQASTNSSSVLLHDILIAVELGRKGMLNLNRVISLLRPFTVCRPCTTGVLYAPRTTVNLEVLSTASPKGPNRLSKGRNFLSEDSHIPQQHTEFVKVVNPAMSATLQCCCRLLVEHQCELYAHRTTDDFCPHLDRKFKPYYQTDNVHALLSLLERQESNWLFSKRAANKVSRRWACLLPQVLVDDLAETLLLTHEVLLLPSSANCRSAVTLWDANSDEDSKRCNFVCPLASRWLPSYCLTRHLHTFYNGSQIILEDETVQEVLDDDASMQSKQSRVRGASYGCSDDRTSETSSWPNPRLPNTMQSAIPLLMSDAFSASMWSRLAAGVAVNRGTITDILRQWECSALERFKREIEKGNVTAGPDKPPTASHFDFSMPSRSDGADDQAGVDTAEPIRTELYRILKLMPEQADATQMRIQPKSTGQTGQKAVAQRQQLLEQIARYIEEPR